jgi:hypothetical protein
LLLHSICERRKKIQRRDATIAKKTEAIVKLKSCIDELKGKYVVKKGAGRYFHPSGALQMAMRSIATLSAARSVGILLATDVHSRTVRNWQVIAVILVSCSCVTLSSSIAASIALVETHGRIACLSR